MFLQPCLVFWIQLVLIPQCQFDHNWLHATRIGEALNPGPDGHWTICHINPTAVTSKKDLILALGADVIALSVTLATPPYNMNSLTPFVCHHIGYGGAARSTIKLRILRC